MMETKFFVMVAVVLGACYFNHDLMQKTTACCRYWFSCNRAL